MRPTVQAGRPAGVFVALLRLTVFVTAATKVSTAFKANILEALMMESLRDNRLKACDGETITLHCPRNTHVLAQTVFYGRLVPGTELCPSEAVQTPSEAEGPRQSSAKRFPARPEPEDTGCDQPDAHARMLETCRGKRKCRIVVEPSFFGDRDACPTTRKYLQVSYKCKPVSFEDQSFCEGTTMQLACRSKKRLAIYSAQYGRTVNGQAQRCDVVPNTASVVSLPPVVREDCVNDVLPHVLRRCHAQAACALAVNDHFFGNPCVNSTANSAAKQLSLIYMCVNDEVFSESALSRTLESMRALEEELETTTTVTLKPNSTTVKMPRAQNVATVNNGVHEKATVTQELDLSDDGGLDDEDDYSYSNNYSKEDDDEEAFLGKLITTTTTTIKPTTAKSRSIETVRAESMNDRHDDVHDDLDYDGAKSGNFMDARPSNFPPMLSTTTTAEMFDSNGLGFAEDFIRYLKDNHEESLSYVFLFVMVGLIALLVFCLCCHFRRLSDGHRHRRRFGSLVIRQGGKTGRKFFGAHYQTVSVSASGGPPASFSSTASTSSTSSGGGGGTGHFYNNRLTSVRSGCEPQTAWRRPASVASCKRVPYSARATQQQYDGDFSGNLLENNTNGSSLYSDSDGGVRLTMSKAVADPSVSDAYMPYWDTYGSAYGIISVGSTTAQRPPFNDGASRPSFSRNFAVGLPAVDQQQQNGAWPTDYTTGSGSFHGRRSRPSLAQLTSANQPQLAGMTPHMRRLAAIATPTPTADLSRYNGDGFLQHYPATARSAIDEDASSSRYSHYATAVVPPKAEVTLPRAPISLHHYG